MRRRAVLFAAAVTLVACGDEPAAPTGVPTAAVRVEAEGCTSSPTVGAGAFIAPDRVLTVAHVVAGSPEVEVRLVDDTEVDATVVGIDRRKDLALLAVDRGDLPDGLAIDPLPLGRIRPGESGEFVVWRSAKPVTQRFRDVAFVGIDADDIDGNGPATGSMPRRGMRIDATVADGDSGSVLIHRGQAVGVVFARSIRTPSQAWATDVREALPLLRADTGDAVDVGACPAG